MSIYAKDVRVLIINGSPRKKNNSSMFVNAAVKGVESLGATAVVYDLAGKRFEHCLETCKAYHKRTGNCMIDDDLHELSNEWIRADGLIYVAPLFHMGMPSAMYAIITRLGATVYGHCDGKPPRLLKAGGAVVHGNTQYGGQEMVMEYLNAHLMLMNCVPVTGDKPESYIGTGARVLNDGTIERNDEILENTYSLGRRVVEMANILNAGKTVLRDSLPEEYLYDANRKFCAPKKNTDDPK
ncbi:MAG: flavodoxin family protein [Bacillota bacterium]